MKSPECSSATFFRDWHMTHPDADLSDLMMAEIDFMVQGRFRRFRWQPSMKKGGYQVGAC